MRCRDHLKSQWEAEEQQMLNTNWLIGWGHISVSHSAVIKKLGKNNRRTWTEYQIKHVQMSDHLALFPFMKKVAICRPSILCLLHPCQDLLLFFNDILHWIKYRNKLTRRLSVIKCYLMIFLSSVIHLNFHYTYTTHSANGKSGAANKLTVKAMKAALVCLFWYGPTVPVKSLYTLTLRMTSILLWWSISTFFPRVK